MEVGRWTLNALLIREFLAACERCFDVDSESPSRLSRWALLRVPVGAGLVVELLSGDWIRLPTHFSGRTFLCTNSSECPLCEILPARSFWYLPVGRVPGMRPALLELSSHASADLEQVCKLAFGTMGPGARVELSRSSKRKPVRSEAIESVLGACRVNLQTWGSALMAIYGLPQFGALETLEAYGERVRGRVFERAEVVAARLRAGVRR